MGAVTVITSGKGGVGKSSVTAGLGAALARRGKRVLLVDGDAGLRSLDTILGITENLVFDISDVVTGNCEPAKAIYPCRGCTGLYIIPAPMDAGDKISPDVMRQLISVLTRYYDHILIDSPAGVGMGFRASVAPATRALVVATPDPVCLRDSDKVRQTLNQNGVTQQRLVINRFSNATFKKMAFYDDLDSVIDASGIRLIAVIPEDCEVTIAAAKGLPISGNSPAAAAFTRFAARMDGEDVPLIPLEKF